MMMKRRNLDCSKLRRSLKRNRIIESLNSSTTAYLKVIIIWIIVLFANHLAGFHFEYLWPVWLMVCSVYDSFKYQGLAFSAFFVGVTVTSDMLCYFLIPIQWLFFSASTFVWVQYVYQTERAITLPTIGLWFMFVTFEASLRIQGIKSLPYHIDLCRPFATHCIGYPMVTLGFGVKSYISYKIRLRRQRETERDNAFLYDLVDMALPEECRQQSRVFNNFANRSAAPSSGEITQSGQPPDSLDDLRRNGQLVHPHDSEDTSSKASSDTHESRGTDGNLSSGASHLPGAALSSNNHSASGNRGGRGSSGLPRSNSGFLPPSGFIYVGNKSGGKNKSSQLISASALATSGDSSSQSNVLASGSLASQSAQQQTLTTGTVTALAPTTSAPTTSGRDDGVQRLEAELRRLRAELQTFRSLEIELKAQIAVHSTNDRMLKSELQQVKQENEMVQSKLQNTINAREQQAKMAQALEKRLAEEKKQRISMEQQLAAERKAAAKVKAEQQEKQQQIKANSTAPPATTTTSVTTTIANATPSSSPSTQHNGPANFARSASTSSPSTVIVNGTECGEQCRVRRREVESDLAQLKRELRSKDDVVAKNMERLDAMQSQLNQLRESNERLEYDLAAESKLKLRLLTALSETKKMVENQQTLLDAREQEIRLLQDRISHFVNNIYVPAVHQQAQQPQLQAGTSGLQSHQQSVVTGNHPYLWGATDAELVGLAPVNGEQFMLNTN